MPKTRRPFLNRWEGPVLRFEMSYVYDAAETDGTTTIGSSCAPQIQLTNNSLIFHSSVKLSHTQAGEKNQIFTEIFSSSDYLFLTSNLNPRQHLLF